MPPRDESPAGGLRLLLMLPLLAAWAALLAFPAAQPEWMVRSFVVRFAPLGFLSVFVFPDRPIRLARALLVGLPAFSLGLAAAGLAIALADWGAAPPGPSDLLLPALALALGVVVALGARRGMLALLLLPLKLAVVALVLGIAVAGLLLAASEPTAAVAARGPLSPAETGGLRASLQGKDPRAIRGGETCSVRLTQEDLDRLTKLVWPRIADPARVRATIALPSGDTAALGASLRLPLARWLNVQAAARIGIADGRFELQQPRLRLGRFTLPQLLADAFAPLLVAAVRAERPLRPVLAATRELRLETGAASATYGRFELPGGVVTDVLWGEGAAGGPRPAERAPR